MKLKSWMVMVVNLRLRQVQHLVVSSRKSFIFAVVVVPVLVYQYQVPRGERKNKNNNCRVGNIREDQRQINGGSIENINADGTFTHV